MLLVYGCKVTANGAFRCYEILEKSYGITDGATAATILGALPYIKSYKKAGRTLPH